MIDNFDCDADTEEMHPREFRKAYEENVLFLSQVGFEPESTTEEVPAGSRITIPNKELHSRWSIIFKHLLKFFSNPFSRHRLF